MISILACESYKWYGQTPPVQLGKPWYEYRDNALYLSLVFTDWDNDRLMLQRVMDAHVSNVPFGFVEDQVSKYVVDNQTPALHCVFWQKDDLDNFQLKVHISDEKQVAELGANQRPIMIDEFIAKKREYYEAEMQHLRALQEAVRLEEERQEIGRAERRQKRLAREARRLAQGEQVPVVKKPTKQG